MKAPAPDQQLAEAHQGSGDLGSALQAIERGAEVSTPFPDGSLPLTWAVS